MGFQLDTSGTVPHVAPNGDPIICGGVSWSDLSPFTQGYIEAMPWETLRPALGWPVSYEGRTFGFMQTATPLEALAKVRADNPHHVAGRFHVQGVGFYSLAPETLARIIADCEAGGGRYPEGLSFQGGEFWKRRQIGFVHWAPPLTVQLGDDGKVRFAND